MWRPILTKAAIFAVGLLLGLGVWWFLYKRGLGERVLATGPDGGVYAILGKALEQELEENGSRVKFTTKDTRGSRDNLDQLEKGEVDFAFIQSGPPEGEQVRAVASLYQEVVHILTRRDVGALTDLRERPVSVGEVGSGTLPVAEALLHQFNGKLVPVRGLSPSAAVDALLAGEVDAAIIVGAPHSPAVSRAMATGRVHYLDYADQVPALLMHYPYLEPAEIPAKSFLSDDVEMVNVPQFPVRTVGVRSLLVCRADLDDDLVEEVTAQLFASRGYLTSLTPEAYQLDEQSEPVGLPWPLHEGATLFYRRREPGFMERYAEVIALLMSLAATAWGVLGTVSKWSSRKKKNRIDDYYLEVAATFLRIENADISAKVLAEEEDRLCHLRGKAFADLANEKLKADESFRIFQDQLAMCLGEIRERMKRLGALVCDRPQQ